MCKILITGAYGFIGKNLAENFSNKSGYELSALDIMHISNEWYSTNYSWDNLDSIDWGQQNTIIHLAGLAHDTRNTINSSNYYNTNVGLTKKVFDYFLHSESKKFIFFSSVKAVADSLHAGILTENTVPDPKTPYGKSKLEAERFILRQHIPEGKNVYILRPCMIHGPGNKGNLNLLYRFVKMGIPYPLGAFENNRSFTSIVNLNYIIEQIIEEEVAPGIYNVADNEALSTNEVITHISAVLNKKERIWKINQQFIKQIAKLGDILHLPFNSERLLKLTDNYVVSNEKLIKALGASLPISTQNGLLHTIRSFNQ